MSVPSGFANESYRGDATRPLRAPQQRPSCLPAHLGDGVYVQDDPHSHSGIVITVGSDVVRNAGSAIWIDAKVLAALLRWLGAGSEREAIVAGLRAILARDDIGHNPIGVQYGAGFIAGLTYAANAIERGDYQPVPK